MRNDIWAAVLGFLVGAAALAGGQDDDELRDELEELRREAARVLHRNWEKENRPPSNDAGLELGLLPVEDLSTPVPSAIPPTNRFTREDSEQPTFGGMAEEPRFAFGTIEEITDRLREHVDQEVWDYGTLTPMEGTLVALAAPATIGRLREFLNHTLRPRAHRGVTVELDVVDLPWKQGRAVAPAGVAITNAQRTAIEELLRAGEGARVLSLRGSGLLGSRFYVWHGRHIAMRVDSEVEVAQTASISDPIVQIAAAGGMLAVTAESLGDADAYELDLDVQLRELAATRTSRTELADELQLPEITDDHVRLVLRAPGGRWVVAGAARPRPGVRRLVLVRAVGLARGLPKGGGR